MAYWIQRVHQNGHDMTIVASAKTVAIARQRIASNAAKRAAAGFKPATEVVTDEAGKVIDSE